MRVSYTKLMCGYHAKATLKSCRSAQVGELSHWAGVNSSKTQVEDSMLKTQCSRLKAQESCDWQLWDIRRMAGWMQDASGSNSLGTEQTIPFPCHTIDDLGQVLASRCCFVVDKGWAYSHECTAKVCWACSASLNQTGQNIVKMTDLAYSHGCFVYGWLTITSLPDSTRKR